jgi:protein SCO1/2
MKSPGHTAGNRLWGFGFIVLSCFTPGPAMAAEEATLADYFPAVTLKTQDNKEVRFYDDLIRGKIVLINFFYTRCDGRLCDSGTRNLVQLQKALGDRLGRDVFIYSITFDPEHDTPAVLKKYAEEYGAKTGWLFLNGKQADIAALQRKLGMTLPETSVNAAPGATKRHTGMIKIGNGAFDKWTSTSILAKPNRMLELIDRISPPRRSQSSTE